MSISIWSLVLELLGLESVGCKVGIAGFRIVLFDDADCYVLRWVESGGVVVVLYGTAFVIGRVAAITKSKFCR